MNSTLSLSKFGPHVSPLILGTWRWLETTRTVQELNRLINAAVDLGITTLDTAEIYGDYDMEEALGKALALSPGLRARVQLITKAGIYVPNKYHLDREVSFYNTSKAQLLKSLEKSLKFLQTDYVELFLVHRPDFLTAAPDTASGLDRMMEKGFTKHVGVSNYTASQFSCLQSFMSSTLVTNQVEFHLLDMSPAENGVLDQCQQLGIVPLAWSPLAGGALLQGQCSASQRFLKRCASWLDRYEGATPDQIALAWLRQHPSRPIPVLGTSQVPRLEKAHQTLGLSLTREDWYQLWTDAKGHTIP